MRFTIEDLVVARVLNEDDTFVTLEICKDDNRKLQLDPDTPDQFFTMAFMKNTPDGMIIWKPWE